MRANYILGLALAVLMIGTFITEAWPQQKQKFTFTPPSTISKYEEQHAIDVGDVQGHQIRVYSIHSVYTQEAPLYEGVKAKESWLRALSDYTDGSGHATG
jgi:hypothetical protein